MYKYLYKYIIILGVLSSCNEDRINLDPISQERQDDFYHTSEQIEQAVIAAYDALQLRGQYGQNFVYLMEVRSDNSLQQRPNSSGGLYGDIDLFREEPSNSVIDMVWKDCYRGIQRCNIVLNRIESVPNNPKKEIQKGEVKFIRALTYFNLVRLFGDVPLVTKEYDDPFEAFNLGRTPKTEVYAQIIKDLTEASQSLDERAIRTGGANKDAAYALLGKVYLTLKNFPEAISMLNKVNGGTLEEEKLLITNYANIFGIANENNIESLFEIQFKKGGIGEGSPYANLFTPYGQTQLVGGVGSTEGDNLPTQELYTSYAENDLREDATIGYISKKVMYTKKYLDTPYSDQDGDNNFIVLRYADVFLMLAEALNEQEYVANGEAFKKLNAIRKRAGLASLTPADLTTQESFRNAVLNERRWEFAFENHRWFDLLRFGKALEVMNHKFDANPSKTIQESQLLFPIPQSQIDATNGKITQNPGYN